MSVLKVLTYGEKTLREPSKEIHKVSSKVKKLVDDLFDTMYAYNGVGLAASQVGINQRIFVLDTAGEDEPLNPIVFINPKIVKKTGAINSYEGCLSFPEVYTNVKRYENVIVRAKDLKGKIFTIEAKGGTLLARAIQHEMDHLDGHLFIDHVRNRFDADKQLAEKGLPPVDPDFLIDEADLEAEIQEKEKNMSEQQETNQETV